MKSINGFIEENRNEMLSFLETIVNMDSATENRDGVNNLGEVLADRFRALGFHIEKDKQTNYGDHLVCRLPGRGSNSLIIGHFDTALPAGTAIKNPFHIINGKGYGPGAADMKAGLVVAIFAIEALLKTTSINPDLTVILNSDEEPGSPTSRDVIKREASKADRAFIMEGSSGNSVITRRKGVGIFNFKCRGIAAHAGADPEQGKSAVVELANLIQNLNALNDPKPSTGVTVNVGVVKGGTYPYVIAEHAEALVDCRIPTAEDERIVLNKFESFTKEPSIDGVSITWEGRFHRPPMERTEESRELFALVQQVGTQLGIPIKEGYSGGASDGNLTSAMGIPTLCGMGPEGYGCHSPEEYVVLESMVDRTKLFAQVLYRLYNNRDF